MDQICIKGLKVFAHHGVLAEETAQGQNFYVNAVLYLNCRPAGLTDDLSASVDYGEVCRFITGYMQKNTFLLIETVAERVAGGLLQSFEALQMVEIEICKPHAPVGLPFDDISVKICRGWHQTFIALGSNEGDKEAAIGQAVEWIKECREHRVVKVSGLYKTEPYGGVEQDEFLNGAMEIQTLYNPEELLSFLKTLETRAGRKDDGVHWGPRPLDLDILLYDQLVMNGEQLTIPHIDMANREFVLVPLAEIAGYVRHPVTGRTIRQMADGLAEGRRNENKVVKHKK